MQQVNVRRFSINDILWLILMTIIEVAIVVCFGTCFEIGDLSDPANRNNKEIQSEVSEDLKSNLSIFMNINVIVWAAFPILYTYLKFHTLSSAVMTFFCGLFSFQVYLLFLALFRAAFNSDWNAVQLRLSWFIEANFGAAVTMITVGGVLGKFNLKQYFVISILEPFFCALNYCIGEELFYVTDAGGSMYVHTFGALFGFTLCAIAFRGENKSEKVKKFEIRNGSNFNTGTLAFFGTILIWLYWPSFNTGLIEGNERYRGIINTWFALLGGGIGAILVTFTFNKGKLSSEDVLNATLAGGVMIAGSCNIIVKPYESLIIGLIAGVVSTFGFKLITPCAKALKIYDTAGIFNSHGITGVIGGFITPICVSLMNTSEFYDFFSELNPKWVNDNRDKKKQAGFQVIVLLITIGISALSGLFIGIFISMESLFGDLDSYYFDGEFFLEENADENHEQGTTAININQNILRGEENINSGGRIVND